MESAMTHLSPRAIEAGAKAAYHATPRNKPYDKLTLFKKEIYRAEARAVLTALEAEGLVVVPDTPTDAMIKAGRDRAVPSTQNIGDIYRSMLQAAQGGVNAFPTLDGEDSRYRRATFRPKKNV